MKELETFDLWNCASTAIGFHRAEYTFQHSLFLTEAVPLCTPYASAFEWQLTEYCSFHYTPKTVPLFPLLTPPLQPVGLHGLMKLFPFLMFAVGGFIVTLIFVVSNSNFINSPVK